MTKKLLEFKDLINESQLKFTDISSETRRTYLKGWGVVEDIYNPIALHVSESGGHRILDAQGKCYYIKPDCWNKIQWRVKEGQPHFVK